MIFSILVNIECIVDFSEFSPGKNKAKISPDIRGVPICPITQNGT